MGENKDRQNLFRAKTIERISSPEKLTDYLKVTNPGIWVVLGAVVLLLGGLLIWASVGTLNTTADIKVIVEDHTAKVVTEGDGELKEGMPFTLLSNEYFIAATAEDEYGRVYGISELALPDGVYEGTAVIEQVRPIDFLLESR